VDSGVKAFLMRSKRGARNTLHALSSWGFNRELTAARFQPFDQHLNLAAGRNGRVISKPFAQHVSVGHGGFPEAESSANLGTHPLGRAADEECLDIHRNPQVELPAQGRDPVRIDFGHLSGKPAAITEEGQEDGEAEPRPAALGHHQGVIVRRHDPRIVSAADFVHHALTAVVPVTSDTTPASSAMRCRGFVVCPSDADETRMSPASIGGNPPFKVSVWQSVAT
jgi:hypothetical protein